MFVCEHTASSSTTATSDSVQEPQPRDFHASMAPLAEPVMEENSKEELDLDAAKELKEDMAKKIVHIKVLVISGGAGISRQGIPCIIFFSIQISNSNKQSTNTQ